MLDTRSSKILFNSGTYTAVVEQLVSAAGSILTAAQILLSAGELAAALEKLQSLPTEWR